MHFIAFTGLAYEKIEMLFVDPQYFGQGLGTKLIQHAFYCIYWFGL